MAALSNENLLPIPLQDDAGSEPPVYPALEPYQGKSARQRAIETIVAFGTPRIMYLGVNKDTIGRVSVRKEPHWQCEHHKYMSLNVDFAERRKRRVIVIDIDDRWEDDVWQKLTDLILDGEIPMPAFACTRLVSRGEESRRTRAHLVYPLQFPINEGDQKQKFFMDVVLDQFYDVLESHSIPVDRRQGVTFKNPAAHVWDVHFFTNHRHSLRDWAEMLGISDLEEEEKKAKNIARYKKRMARRAGRKSGITGERNLDVFELARHKCYAAKARCVSYEQFHIVVSDIVQETHDGMNFPSALSSKEISQITKSIAEWTWYKYEGSDYCDRNRGACSDLLEFGMDRQDRQRIGAGYTHDRRAQKALEKVKTAYDQLKAAGEKISVRTLAGSAGVSTTTAQKYRRVVETGAKIASKAVEFANEVKAGLAKTSQVTAESPPLVELYHDGASEYPQRERPNSPPLAIDIGTLIEGGSKQHTGNKSPRVRNWSRRAIVIRRPKKRTHKPKTSNPYSVPNPNTGRQLKPTRSDSDHSGLGLNTSIQTSKLIGRTTVQIRLNGNSKGRSPPLA